MRRRGRTGLFLAATMALAACSGEEAATPSAGTSATEPTATVDPSIDTSSTSDAATGTTSADIERPEGTIEWTDCTEEILEGECATISVPVDYDDPAGATVELALFRRPATGARLGVLLVNPGGPGGSGVDFANGWQDLFPPEWDLIGFDPRGLQRSQPVDCISDAVTDESFQLPVWPDPSDLDALLAEIARQTTACLEIDLASHIGTVDVARDMDQIRIALGEEQINYGGFSYGARLGWTYASLFPDRVRAMVLDGPEDPTADVATTILRQAQGMQDQLDAFVEFCATDPYVVCPDDPAAAIVEIIARAEDAPIATTLPFPPLSGQLALLGIQAGFYSPDGWGDLGLALLEALDGDGDRLIEFGSFITGRQPDGTYDDEEGRGFVWCKDHTERPTVAEFEAITAQVSDVFTVFGPYPGSIPYCYMVPTTDEPTPMPAEQMPPVLVVTSTGDWATPMIGAQHLTELLGDAVLLTRAGNGHTSYGRNECIDGYIIGFWRDLRLPEHGTVCADE